MAKVICRSEAELDVSGMHFIFQVDSSFHETKNLELPKYVIEQYNT